MHRRNRLGSGSLIRRVYAEGARIRAGSVTLTVVVQGDAPPAVAAVASKRVGGAVARNRVRRRLRAAIAPLVGSMRPGTIAVMAATPAAGAQKFQDLEADVVRALARAGLTGAMNA